MSSIYSHKLSSVLIIHFWFWLHCLSHSKVNVIQTDSVSFLIIHVYSCSFPAGYKPHLSFESHGPGVLASSEFHCCLWICKSMFCASNNCISWLVPSSILHLSFILLFNILYSLLFLHLSDVLFMCIKTACREWASFIT